MKNILPALLMVLFLYSCGSGELDEKSKKMLVYNYAIDDIKTRIKDPNSIETPSLTEKASHVTVTNADATEFHIDSWFRSKNSFGAMVKSTFSCDVTISKDGNSISGRNLKIK
ncbi:hypothetical protein N8927_05890 [Crocinitomicaceae bacterium]|nr:hypothetical protein [Crocinitomicaceae bacterium]